MLNEAFHNFYSTTYYYGGKIKEDEMGKMCSTYGRDDKYTQNFSCHRTLGINKNNVRILLKRF